MCAGDLVRFDLLSAVLSPTAANLSVLTKWMRLVAHCVVIGFFLYAVHIIHTVSRFEEFATHRDGVHLRGWWFFASP